MIFFSSKSYTFGQSLYKIMNIILYPNINNKGFL